MIRIFKIPQESFWRLLALLFPMFHGTTAAGQGTAGEWLARGLIVAVVAALLGLLNQAPQVDAHSWLHSPWPILNSFWIPLLALSLYFMCWLGWWFWLALRVDTGPTSAFPDIDAAWGEATEELARTGVLLQDVPVYLILGQSAAGETALFQSAGLNVNQFPPDPLAPLHLVASPDAVFVTCPGASCLGLLTATSAEAPGPAAESEVSDEGPDLDSRLGVGLRRWVDAIFGHAEAPDPRLTSARRRTIEVQPLKARLAHLCRLIARDRGGFCPINGVLVLIPAAVTDPHGDAEGFIRCCRADLSVVLEVLGIRCPTLALVCDMERLPGFTEAVAHLPPGQTSRRIGQRFPLVTNLRPEEVGTVIEEGIDWVSRSLFPNMIYSLFRLEAPGREDVEGVVFENSELFRLIAEIRARRKRLAQILVACFAASSREHLLFGGCYFGGTGSDTASSQAFVSGVFARLIQDQDHVTWSESALRDDARARQVARLLGLFLAVANVFTAGVAVYLLQQLFRGRTS